MSKFEQKLCFGLLQLKKKITFFGQNHGSTPLKKYNFPIYTVFGFKMYTKIVFGDVLDRE